MATGTDRSRLGADQHTLAGKKLGRGLDHFRSEGAKLVPPLTGDDPYEDEAYRLWAIKQTNRYQLSVLLAAGHRASQRLRLYVEVNFRDA